MYFLYSLAPSLLCVCCCCSCWPFSVGILQLMINRLLKLVTIISLLTINPINRFSLEFDHILGFYVTKWCVVLKECEVNINLKSVA